MWDSIWINVLLPDGRDNPGAIGVQDGKIAWVGPQASLTAAPETLAKTIYNGANRWVTPGLVDCHTHLVYGGNRAREFEMRLQGVSYEDIAKAGGGILSTMSATRAATEDELFASSYRRLQNLMAEGVTGIEIKSGYGLDMETERKMLVVATKLAQATGIRIQRTFLGAHALPPEYKNRSDDYITHICEDMLPALHEAGLVDAVDVFCERIGFTLAQAERVFQKAQQLGLPVKIHAEQLSNQHGSALAARSRALSADHLEYLDEDGVKAMAASGTIAVLLPGAYYFLRETRLPPIDLLRKHSVPIAIATDHNPGTSPVHSLLLMMNMACTIFHLTPQESLAGVTCHAAAALGWNDSGKLEQGARADFALWDIGELAELSYSIGHNACYAVVRNGLYVAIPQSRSD
ncbi:MAG: imidazolonepropionase [Micavibrio aeruginosavorus]|uniref:Imidazolonepropionase n=1 Tax=Micavibrio aeruginosavorus TaxID=349221 RepID=A0A7T5R0V8_9BACT|nr:MAG: imidazolonepropionase [Micavibrio aeruginosavorus]